MENYFKATKESPYHISVGAVLINDKNEVACHYFEKITLHKAYADLVPFYLLMRETMEMGETIEQTVHRGLLEEFGATGEIVTFLGSINQEVEDPRGVFEKTTLYFLVRLKSFNPDLRSQDDAEKESEIQWQSFDFLIDKMAEQKQRLPAGLSETEIVQRAKKYLEK